MKRINTKEEKKIKFEKYVDEILCGLKPDEPYSRLVYPVKYAEWQRDVHLVREIIYERMRDSRWYHEFRDEINELVAVACLATKFVNEIANKEKKDREVLTKPSMKGKND